MAGAFAAAAGAAFSAVTAAGLSPLSEHAVSDNAIAITATTNCNIFFPIIATPLVSLELESSCKLLAYTEEREEYNEADITVTH
jgi:hypothetical protein